eukprot:GHRR01036428.1.p2 GENE.GHRR01036428.1~~GHRR01036428.1.p2  ORF type:complete len:109 (+),score=10.28 GHRR01036428.1:263-589(+)
MQPPAALTVSVIIHISFDVKMVIRLLKPKYSRNSTSPLPLETLVMCNASQAKQPVISSDVDMYAKAINKMTIPYGFKLLSPKIPWANVCPVKDPVASITRTPHTGTYA